MNFRELKIFVTLCGLFFLAFSSCDDSKESLRHKGAQQFYNELSSISKYPIHPSTEFNKYFREVAPIAAKNINYQVEGDKVDSLRNLYNRMINSFDNAITSLKHLKEFDTTFNIVAPALENCEILKDVYHSTIPTY